MANRICCVRADDVAERGERIPIPGTAPRGLGRGQADVLAARHVVVAKPIRRFGDAADVLDRGVLLPRQRGAGDVGDDGRGDAEFHCSGSSPARIVRCMSRPLSTAYGSARCMVPVLSQMSRSPSCHSCR